MCDFSFYLSDVYTRVRPINRRGDDISHAPDIAPSPRRGRQCELVAFRQPDNLMQIQSCESRLVNLTDWIVRSNYIPSKSVRIISLYRADYGRQFDLLANTFFSLPNLSKYRQNCKRSLYWIANCLYVLSICWIAKTVSETTHFLCFNYHFYFVYLLLFLLDFPFLFDSKLYDCDNTVTESLLNEF